MNLSRTSCRPTLSYTSRSTCGLHQLDVLIHSAPSFHPLCYFPSKAFLPFGTVYLIKHTEGQRAALASKLNLNRHHVPKASITILVTMSSITILVTMSSTHLRVPILSCVATSRSSPSYLSDGNPKQSSNRPISRTSIPPMKISSSVAIILDQLDQPLNDPSADSAQIDQVTRTSLPPGNRFRSN